MNAPRSDDALRIATRLRAGASQDRAILVTSGGPDEGSGALAGDLAAAFARLSAGTVLLVEADFDRPRAHLRFGAPRSPGLTEILRGGASIDQAVHSTGIERLAIVPAGEGVEDPMALLSGPGLAAFVDAARQRFGHLVVDAPAFQRSAVASLLAGLVEGTVLVVGAGLHSHTQVHEMQRELRQLRARTLGIVLSEPGR